MKTLNEKLEKQTTASKWPLTPLKSIQYKSQPSWRNIYFRLKRLSFNEILKSGEDKTSRRPRIEPCGTPQVLVWQIYQVEGGTKDLKKFIVFVPDGLNDAIKAELEEEILKGTKRKGCLFRTSWTLKGTWMFVALKGNNHWCSPVWGSTTEEISSVWLRTNWVCSSRPRSRF